MKSMHLNMLLVLLRIHKNCLPLFFICEKPGKGSVFVPIATFYWISYHCCRLKIYVYLIRLFP